ncbi:MAG: CTP synthase [Candidatus Moraniibacteriota bacterium]|nr:MAG: CTP synthase [Candidatus Moranbacteria bacterium]
MKRKQKPRSKQKYIFVVGGVMSGVGKGITASSIGKILQSRGLTVTAMKIDPYINVDAGTMNPTEHGEVFVLADGYETDQDMGNYERFMGLKLTRANYMTTGSIYQEVIERERNLEYGGKCVQVVPHIPLEVIGRIKQAGKKAQADVTIVEIGGTVGEYENILFLEAVRMLKIENPQDVLTVMVSYVPTPSKVGEMKTKPTQHAVRTLNGTGIQPDFIIARADRPLDDKRKEKIAVFCNVGPDAVISAPDVESIYDVPINFEKDQLSDRILERFGLRVKKRDLGLWKRKVAMLKQVRQKVKIGIVGKYFKTGDYVLSDAYISVIESLKHAAYATHQKPELHWLDATEYEKEPEKLSELKEFDGVLIPGGFGARGVEGKIKAIEYCRVNKIPYFGLCYGMQLLVIEYARHVLKLTEANTHEINPQAKHLVIDVMPDQKKKLAEKNYGGSMRLGEYPAKLLKESIAFHAYQSPKVIERHRHRYEVNPVYVERLKKGGLIFSATSPDGVLMEIAELPREKHPFFLGTQFHPEFQSSLLNPHPLFVAFLEACKRG